MSRIFNVLFLCTGNSARSILAEGILAAEAGGRFRAFSAGSHPKGEVHPLAIETLERFGCPTAGLRSKSWDEFEQPAAPVLDFVFTVCDSAAGEVCPIWPGQPITAHWGIEDPSSVEGDRLVQARAFATAFRQLKNRIGAFAALPLDRLDRASLAASLRDIGKDIGTANTPVEHG